MVRPLYKLYSFYALQQEVTPVSHFIFQMSISRTNNSRFDREALKEFHSRLTTQSTDVNQLLRYYYAGSSLILQMDLRPFLELSEEELSLVFSAPKYFSGKQFVIRRVMDRLIEMVCVR